MKKIYLLPVIFFTINLYSSDIVTPNLPDDIETTANVNDNTTNTKKTDDSPQTITSIDSNGLDPKDLMDHLKKINNLETTPDKPNEEYNYHTYMISRIKLLVNYLTNHTEETQHNFSHIKLDKKIVKAIAEKLNSNTDKTEDLNLIATCINDELLYIIDKATKNNKTIKNVLLYSNPSISNKAKQAIKDNKKIKMTLWE